MWKQHLSSFCNQMLCEESTLSYCSAMLLLQSTAETRGQMVEQASASSATCSLHDFGSDCRFAEVPDSRSPGLTFPSARRVGAAPEQCFCNFATRRLVSVTAGHPLSVCTARKGTEPEVWIQLRPTSEASHAPHLVSRKLEGHTVASGKRVREEV